MGLYQGNKALQRFCVQRACGIEEIVMARALDPESLLRFVCLREEPFPVPERDHSVLLAMDYKDRAPNAT